MSNLLLEHYSLKPVGPIEDRAQAGEPQPYGKPDGLWVSVKGDDDWPSWCRSEEFQMQRLQFCARFELAADHDVLIISSTDELLAFNEQYGSTGRFGHGTIDWRDVAKERGGVIIAPYNWELRLDRRVTWYYGWDCASGCIWNAAALVRVAADEGAVA